MAGTAGLGPRGTRGFLEHHKVIGVLLTLALLVALGVGSGELLGSLLARLVDAGLTMLNGGG